ncbi:MAG: hypothetical protein LBF43_01285 [Puniceicoccales bacterium]|nr:hypothetical protein [Puniceicoccales bacterium]
MALLTPQTLVVYAEPGHYQTVMEVHTPWGATWQLLPPPVPAPPGPAGDE